MSLLNTLFIGIRGKPRRAVLRDWPWLARIAGRVFSLTGATVVINNLHRRRTLNQIWFRCKLGERVGRNIFWRGGHRKGFLWLFPLLLPKHGVFIDVGANQGELTLLASSRMPKGLVHAFEPHTGNLADLADNMALNTGEATGRRVARITVHPCALGAENGVGTLYARSATALRSWWRADSDSLSLAKARGRAEPVAKVGVRRLDDELKMAELPFITLMHIDAAGFEADVLRGGRETLARHKPTLLIAIDAERLAAAGSSPAALMGELAALGYCGYEILRTGWTWLDPGMQKGMALFVHGEEQATKWESFAHKYEIRRETASITPA